MLMMLSLPISTWIRLFVWLVIGLAIYFLYSRKHSRVQMALAESNQRGRR